MCVGAVRVVLPTFQAQSLVDNGFVAVEGLLDELIVSAPLSVVEDAGEFLAAQSYAEGGLITGIPYFDIVLGVLVAIYLTVTPGVLLGAFDAYLFTPLDILLQKKIKEEDIKLVGRLGSGTFGDVYDATLGNSERRVVVKKCKGSKEAAELQETEEWMNRRLRRSLFLAKGAAPYLGSYTAAGGRVGASRASVLVWDYKGSSTLEALMVQRGFPLILEEEMFGSPQRGSTEQREQRIVQRIMQQVLTALSELHGTGIVHRDVKPSNLVLMDGKFKLVDFGAATDLRIGKNYVPDLSLLDPSYCPPEQYVMPEDTPVPPPAPVAAALSPLLWQLNRPDLFDTYSAGLIMLQLSIPNLRTKNALLPTGIFQRNLRLSEYDLKKWREDFTGPTWDFSLLDQRGGFDLAASLVCSRNTLRRGRASASVALLHPFLLL
ncbi:hypothetical protein CYMTET_31437 [Cymbomonas tetramitiformis]|uniref:Protein kinase domain-containing protein n=1 Tax=Cymbomonas tetramitiformis TaxID=36881 RepID=A0AAE0FHI5_9CHLO|nr:hypothetical protein CYMTET_31437 [Cymbomonas tetramitiformis]